MVLQEQYTVNILSVLFYYLVGWLAFVRLGQGILRMCDNWYLLKVDTIFVLILSSCNYINVTKTRFSNAFVIAVDRCKMSN